MYYQDDTDTLTIDCECQPVTTTYAEFENPAVTGIIPAGYMTSSDFRRLVKNDIYNYCRKNGLL